MSRVLQVNNRQRLQRIDTRVLKRMLVNVLDNDLGVRVFEVGIHLVGAGEMTCVNETFLKHEGSTDVITFNHRDGHDDAELHGEIFVCVDEAIALAPRFKASWQAEVIRYAIHGFLHLQGFDDHEPADRRAMKRVENRVMRSVRKRFAVTAIAPRVSRGR